MQNTGNRKTQRQNKKIFLDSSVLFAAILSPGGGAFRILLEASPQNLEIFITPYVLSEVDEALTEKYPERRDLLDKLLAIFPIHLVPDPSESLVETFISRIDPEDAPVVAGALFAKAKYLLTFDKKHLLAKKEDFARLLNILTPGDFIQQHFKS